MTELFLNPVFVSITGGVLICLGSSLIHSWSKVRRTSIEADLKREMIERGMSADEICRVIESRAGDRCGKD